MTNSEAIEKLKNMRLYMQIEDENNDCKFTEDDYKANEMAIQALEKQIPKKPISYDDCEQFVIRCTCGKCTDTRFFHGYCTWCGQKLDFGE